MWNLFDVIVFIAGFAASWFGKDPITKAVVGTENFAKALETRAAAVRAVV